MCVGETRNRSGRQNSGLPQQCIEGRRRNGMAAIMPAKNTAVVRLNAPSFLR